MKFIKILNNILFFIGQIDLATADWISQANVITLTKQGAGSNQNFSTTLVAESKNENVSEIGGEPIWKKYGYFGQLRIDYNLEKCYFIC